jgi:hypothetical protein
VAAQNEFVRACSNGSVRIDGPDATYYLSPPELRGLLFFGNTTPLHLPGGVIDGESYASPHRNGRIIVIVIRDHVYHISRESFTRVARGMTQGTPMVAVPAGGGT